MLTPEEVREILLPVDMDKLIENGVDADDLAEEFYTDANGVYHYQQVFDKPMEEGGTPFTGLSITFFDNFDQIDSYTEMKDGYPFGDEVGFHESGALASYERTDDKEHYAYTWFENGVLRTVYEWNRPDKTEYYRAKAYDKTGKLIWMHVDCEIKVTYQPDEADSPFEFTFHANGEFRQIKYKAPSARDFYSAIEFGTDGHPVRYDVNPHFNEDSLEKRLRDGYPRCKTFEPGKYRFQDGVLQYYNGTHGTTWLRASGKIHFHEGTDGDKILEYDMGIPRVEQCIYYPSGQIREQYFVSKGKEYYRHIYWHPNGVMREAIVYGQDQTVKLHVKFDKQGNQI